MKRLAVVAVLLLGAADAWNLFGGYHPHGAWWNSIPLSDAIVGVAGAALLVLVGPRFLKRLLARSEDYYR